DGDLDLWIEGCKERGKKPVPKNAAFARKMPPLVGLAAKAVGLPAPLTTDKAGKFRLTGVGRERVVFVEVEGPGIESMQFNVLTRPGTAKVALESPLAYFAKFTHL